MKALSVSPWYALEIAEGRKTVEFRTWSTDYRGPIVICSTAKKLHGTIPSHALCVVDLVDVQPFRRKHLQAAEMGLYQLDINGFAWILENNRIIEPQFVKGKLSLWNYDGPIIYAPQEIYADEGEDVTESHPWFSEHWDNIMI